MCIRDSCLQRLRGIFICKQARPGIGFPEKPILSIYYRHQMQAGAWRRDNENTETYWNHTGRKQKMGTEPGDGKGGAPLFSPSFGSFSWRSKKRTNILREPGPWRWENCLRAGRRKGPIRTVRPAGAFRSATAAMGGTWRKDRPLHDAALPRGGRQSIQNVPPACTKPSRFRLYPPFTTPLPPFGGSRTEKSLS